MDIKILKEKILDNNVKDCFFIFVNSKNSFLSTQYINKISSISNIQLEYIDDVMNLISDNIDIFASDDITVNSLRIFKCEKFDILDDRLKLIKNLIIITDKITKEAEELFEYNIVKMPDIEDWCIKDYVYSNCDGVDTKDLDWLINLCNNDINRLDNEIKKISIFTKNQRKFLFKDFVRDGIFNDLSQYNIFNITNAIQSKDINALKTILPEISRIDVEPVGLITLMNTNFRKILSVWFNVNPTPENTGLKSNQIWAIKNLPRSYTREQLIDIYKTVTLVDAKLKTGEMPVSLIIDYLIIKILSA